MNVSRLMKVDKNFFFLCSLVLQQGRVFSSLLVGKGWVFVCSHTIPLFKLFPGRPRSTFSTTCSFLGAIFLPFFFVAYVRQKKGERVSCLARRSRWSAIGKAEPAAGGCKCRCKRRGREKKVAGQVRDDVVTEGGRWAGRQRGTRKKKYLLLFSHLTRKKAATLGFHQQCAAPLFSPSCSMARVRVRIRVRRRVIGY